VLVTLPPELGQAQRTELARSFARQLADALGLVLNRRARPTDSIS